MQYWGVKNCSLRILQCNMTTCPCACMYSVSPRTLVHTQLVMFLTPVNIILYKTTSQLHAYYACMSLKYYYNNDKVWMRLLLYLSYRKYNLKFLICTQFQLSLFTQSIYMFISVSIHCQIITISRKFTWHKSLSVLMECFEQVQQKLSTAWLPDQH